MKYLGAKHGIGSIIADFISSQCPPDTAKNGYLEPFCGSLGVFKNMTDKGYDKYIASDIQPDLIEMWKKIQKNRLKLPKSMSEKEYNSLKLAKSPNAMKAVAGFGLSFGGKYFAGLAQKWAGNSGRNFFQEFKNSIDKIKPTITQSNVEFLNKSYIDFNPKHMLIYCDPPYKSTEKYGSTEDFNHEKFWETMREWSKENCVFISEQTAPKDFKSVWSRQKRRTLDSTSRFYIKEHVFIYTGTKTFLKKKTPNHNKTIKKSLKKKHNKTKRNGH